MTNFASNEIFFLYLIEFAHPNDYPSNSGPEFKLCCDWLTESQIEVLRQKFQEICTENFSCVILFIWISVIKDELLEVLDIKDDSINIDELVKFDEDKLGENSAGMPKFKEYYIGIFCNFNSTLVNFLSYNKA